MVARTASSGLCFCASGYCQMSVTDPTGGKFTQNLRAQQEASCAAASEGREPSWLPQATSSPTHEALPSQPKELGVWFRGHLFIFWCAMVSASCIIWYRKKINQRKSRKSIGQDKTGPTVLPQNVQIIKTIILTLRFPLLAWKWQAFTGMTGRKTMLFYQESVIWWAERSSNTE